MGSFRSVVFKLKFVDPKEGSRMPTAVVRKNSKCAQKIHIFRLGIELQIRISSD